MIQDPDVIFVDFDELFDSKSLGEIPHGIHEAARLEQAQLQQQYLQQQANLMAQQIYGQLPMYGQIPMQMPILHHGHMMIPQDHQMMSAVSIPPPNQLNSSMANQNNNNNNNYVINNNAMNNNQTPASNPNTQNNSQTQAPTNNSNNNNNNNVNKPSMTREQFYKIRPKMPRISKNDPRRSYASAFAEAYNSCDFEQIWEFCQEYCTKDILFIHRWVGQEQYLNFPKYLEIKGIEDMAEYWFSRCMIVPDLVLELKETKLYVRSDGFSTVLSSFTIVCTRLYDGEVSDAIICRPINSNTTPTAPSIKEENMTEVKESEPITDLPSTEPVTVEEIKISDRDDNENENDIFDEKAENIENRVFEKMKQILLSHKSDYSAIKSKLKRKLQDTTTSDEDSTGEFKETAKDKIQLFCEKDFNIEMSRSQQLASAANDKTTPASPTESTQKPSLVSNLKKRMPKNTSITLLGTVTLHLNKDHKIKQMELTFALQQ